MLPCYVGKDLESGQHLIRVLLSKVLPDCWFRLIVMAAEGNA